MALNSTPAASGPPASLTRGAGDRQSLMTVEQVLALLNDMMQQLKQATTDKEEIWEKEIKGLRQLVAQVHTCVSSASYDYSQASHGIAPKRKLPQKAPINAIPYIELVANSQVGLEDLVSLLLNATVWSFTRQVRGVRAWIDESSEGMMKDMFGPFESVSGLSLLFFAKRNIDTKAVLRTAVGRAYSHLMHLTMAKKVYIAQQNFNRGTGGPVCAMPEWLKSFKGPVRTMQFVDQILADKTSTVHDVDAETEPADGGTTMLSTASSDDVTGSSRPPPAKKAKASSGAKSVKYKGIPVGVDGFVTDKHENVRDYVIKQSLSRLRRDLSSSRCTAREKAFKDVMFLVEEINRYENAEEAKENGYWIEFDHFVEQDLCNVDDILSEPESMWNVPLSCIDDSDPKAMWVENRKRFDYLKKSFRSLTVFLHYPRLVIREKDDNTDGSPEWDDKEFAHQTTKAVYLHDLASSLIFAAFKMESFDHILSCNNVALRAIHVLALGILGVLRRASGLSSTQAENAAMGVCTAKPVPKDGKNITLMYGDNTRLEGDNRGTLMRMRKEAFSISWKNYLKEKVTFRPPESRQSSHLQDSSSDEEDQAMSKSTFWDFAAMTGRDLS